MAAPRPPRGGTPRENRPTEDSSRTQSASSISRIGVRKTYKLYVGGAFPRSESGRTYLVSGADGSPLAHTRLDARAGVPHPRGCYTAAAGDEPVDLIPGAAFAHIKALGEEGERLMLAGDFRGAFDRFDSLLLAAPCVYLYLDYVLFA